MAQLKASIKFDAAKGTATVSLEPIGATEMEHELLAAYFNSPRSVSLVPFNVADQLESRFIIEDKLAFPRSQRACENRIRVREGRPTVEEQWNKGKTEQEIKAREAANKSAQDAGFVDADAKARFEDGQKRDKANADKVVARNAGGFGYSGPERRKAVLPLPRGISERRGLALSNDDKAAVAAGYDSAADRDRKLADQKAGYEGQHKFVPNPVAFDARPASSPDLYSGPERRKANAPFQGPDRRVRNAGPSPVPAHPETPFEKHERELREQNAKGPVA